jgi:hypothetical protein
MSGIAARTTASASTAAVIASLRTAPRASEPASAARRVTSAANSAIASGGFAPRTAHLGAADRGPARPDAGGLQGPPCTRPRRGPRAPAHACAARPPGRAAGPPRLGSLRSATALTDSTSAVASAQVQPADGPAPGAGSLNATRSKRVARELSASIVTASSRPGLLCQRSELRITTRQFHAGAAGWTAEPARRRARLRGLHAQRFTQCD